LNDSNVIWDDADFDQIATLPVTAPHRDVDLEIIQADEEGYVWSYLVAPATVYGISTNKYAKAGLANKHSIQIPALINASLDRGQAGMVGKGLNIWPNVDIDDSMIPYRFCCPLADSSSNSAADLYIDIYNAIKANPDKVGHGRKGYYFGLNGEHTLYDVGKELGRAMVAVGKSSSEEPTTFTNEEMNKYFQASFSWLSI